MSEISKSFTPELYEAIYSVDEGQDGIRLDQFCAEYLPSFSREQIKRKIKSGEVKIASRPYPHKASVKVYHGEKITISTPRGTLEDEYWNGDKISLQYEPTVLYQDKDLIAISKPPFMTAHPTGKHLFNCATVFFENRDKKKVHSIHRLDRETSGVQILGRNPKSADFFTSLFEKGLVSKAYFFIAHKHKENKFPFVAKERMGGLDDFIPKLYVHCFEEDSSQGKSAQTSFELVKEYDDFILGLAFPKTGRQHQIRAHAAFYGLPLLGDKLYNGDPRVFMRFKDEIASKDDHLKMQIPRHALHAIALKIDHPKRDEPFLFSAPLPTDLIEWMHSNLTGFDLKEIQGTTNKRIGQLFNIKQI